MLASVVHFNGHVVDLVHQKNGEARFLSTRRVQLHNPAQIGKTDGTVEDLRALRVGKLRSVADEGHITNAICLCFEAVAECLRNVNPGAKTGRFERMGFEREPAGDSEKLPRSKRRAFDLLEQTWHDPTAPPSRLPAENLVAQTQGGNRRDKNIQ